MLHTLLESRAVAQRRAGSSLASVLIHGAIIAGGVIATANDTLPVRITEPIVHTVVYRPAPRPRPLPHAHQSDAPATAAVDPAPMLPRLNVASIVPVGIPPVDLSVPPAVADVGRGPIGLASVICDRECGADAAIDGRGRALWSDTDVLMRLVEKPVPPRYPESLRRAGIEGDVVVRFLVDTTGRVDMRSIEIVRSTHEAFTLAVRESLSKLRFAPATAGAHRVAALAIMPFRFRLE